MAKPMIVIVKRFTYRGNQEEWSNQYHFNESPPANPAAWKALVDAVIVQEKTCYPLDVKVTRAYGYADSANDATTMIDYKALALEPNGTLVMSGYTAAPGDAAVWVRWATAKKTSKGKNVYLRKYFHGVKLDGARVANNDAVDATQAAALLAFANTLRTGGVTGFTMCGPDGTAALTATVGPWITTRTLKRRGKRPNS